MFKVAIFSLSSPSEPSLVDLELNVDLINYDFLGEEKEWANFF